MIKYIKIYFYFASGFMFLFLWVRNYSLDPIVPLVRPWIFLVIWTLLIIRDLVFKEKIPMVNFYCQTKDRYQYPCRPPRVIRMCQNYSKHPHPTARRKSCINSLLKGIDLVPVLIEIIFGQKSTKSTSICYRVCNND